MGKSVNKVILVGNVGKQPDIRATQSGAKVANFSLATSSSYKDKSDEWQEKTEWHRCVAFGKTAEAIEKYVGKGSKLYVEGALETREWEKDGIKRYSTEVKAYQVVFLDSRQDSGQQDYQQPQGSQIEPEDIPF